MVNDPDVPPTLCFPGKTEVAEMVAEITGKKMASVENMIAAVRCSRIEGNVRKKLDYIGYGSCAGASLAFGGPYACQYACIGLGDCEQSCPFDAISIKNGFPAVDPDLCVGCGTCVRACPKTIIELMPAQARVWVPCSTKDPGKAVKEVCDIGCISCKICVKSCPAKAISLEEGLIKIDHKACMAYGPECETVCIEKCPRNIMRTFTPVDQQAAQQTEAA